MNSGGLRLLFNVLQDPDRGPVASGIGPLGGFQPRENGP